MTNQRYVLSGPPGAGKTTVLDWLAGELRTVPEPGRRVLAAQRASGGRGTGDQDAALFVSLMLEMALSDFDSVLEADAPIMFDRGLPDLLACAEYYERCNADILCAVASHRYEQRVFWLPAWEDIYVTDNERTMSFDEAAAFGELIHAAYLSCGYQLIEVPRVSVEDRAAFIQAQIG